MKISLIVECKHCKKNRKGYKGQLYSPKDIKKIPKNPVAKCKYCSKYITINRVQLIDYINFQIKKSKKSSTKQTSLIDQDYQLKQEILKHLSRTDKSFHGYMISKKLKIHHSKIYKMINWLKKNKYIEQTSTRPNFYKLSSAGKFYLKYGLTSAKSKTTIENLDQEKRFNNYFGVITEHIHNLSFRLDLGDIPNWIKSYNPIKLANGKYKLQKHKTKSKEIFFKPTILKNWKRPKYYIYLNQADFGGIESVEINIHNIAFNFNRPKDQSEVSTTKGFINYFHERENDVRHCKDFFNTIGFKIIGDEPILHKKIHIAIEYREDINSLAGLGKYITAKITGTNKEIAIDNSPKESGEIEFSDIEKGFNILDIQEKLPGKIEDIENKISDLDNKISSIDQILNNQQSHDNRFDKIEKAIVVLANQNQQTNNQISQLTNNLQTLNNNFSNLINLLNPESPKEKNQTEKNFNNDFYT